MNGFKQKHFQDFILQILSILVVRVHPNFAGLQRLFKHFIIESFTLSISIKSLIEAYLTCRSRPTVCSFDILLMTIIDVPLSTTSLYGKSKCDCYEPNPTSMTQVSTTDKSVCCKTRPRRVANERMNYGNINILQAVTEKF